MKSKKKTLSLSAWVDELGVPRVMLLTGVGEVAVRNWRRGHCLPRDAEKRVIKKASEGRVSYDEMIDTFFNQAK